MALCNLHPTFFRPIPPFYSQLLRRLLLGVGELKSGSLAPGCFACSEQNGWTDARACSLSGDMVERLRPAETWPEAAVPPSHVPLASFQSGTQSPWRSDCSQALAFSCFFAVFFSNSLSRPETPHFASCLGIFFPFMLISLLFLLSGEALNPPHTYTSTHTLVKESKHTRPAECVWLILYSVCGWEMSKWLHALSKFSLRPYAPLRSKSSSPCISSFAINAHNPCSGSQEACVFSTHVSFSYTTLLVFYTKLKSFPEQIVFVV